MYKYSALMRNGKRNDFQQTSKRAIQSQTNSFVNSVGTNRRGLSSGRMVGTWAKQSQQSKEMVNDFPPQWH